jgi:WD40 repeat protein
MTNLVEFIFALTLLYSAHVMFIESTELRLNEPSRDSPRLVYSIYGHQDRITALVHLDDNLLASASYDDEKTIRVWDLKRGFLKYSLTDSSPLNRIEYLAKLDNNLLASATYVFNFVTSHIKVNIFARVTIIFWEEIYTS